jgi:C4-dicarboxylate-specific signal transduction histidine kinase
MGLNLDITAQEGLIFFGRISASISHEIKNVLAILNENAGLLEDLILISEKGMPLNNDRIKSVAATMKSQIKRGDLITRNMNSFAHSIDEPLRSIHVYETMELIVALTERFADMREVKLKLLDHSERSSISTSPFFLQNLIYCCIEYAIDSTGEDRTVHISTQKHGNAIKIKFSNLTGLSDNGPEVFPTKREKELTDLLKADIQLDRVAGCITISIPENFD